MQQLRNNRTFLAATVTAKLPLSFTKESKMFSLTYSEKELEIYSRRENRTHEISDSQVALFYSPSTMISQRSPRSRCLMTLVHYLTAEHRVASELAICFALMHTRTHTSP